MAHKTASNTPDKAKAEAAFKLPTSVATPADVGRLQRELETIDESLLQLGLRRGGSEVKMPKTAQLMGQMIDLNQLNLLQADDRKALQQFLVATQQQAPLLHISFSADPSTAFTDKLIAWLRREIHPLVLITFGLQPNIGAGCVLRTTNKYFDLSLRQAFIDKRDMLREALALPDGAATPSASPELVTVTTTRAKA